MIPKTAKYIDNGGKLNAFSDIGSQAQEHSHRLIEGLKQAQGITEWVQYLNNIRACASEIANEEIIYA